MSLLLGLYICARLRSVDHETAFEKWIADCCDVSIREFCELDTPIFMFDKDGAFVVRVSHDVLKPKPQFSDSRYGCGFNFVHSSSSTPNLQDHLSIYLLFIFIYSNDFLGQILTKLCNKGQAIMGNSYHKNGPTILGEISTTARRQKQSSIYHHTNSKIWIATEHDTSRSSRILECRSPRVRKSDLIANPISMVQVKVNFLFAQKLRALAAEYRYL